MLFSFCFLSPSMLSTLNESGINQLQAAVWGFTLFGIPWCHFRPFCSLLTRLAYFTRMTHNWPWTLNSHLLFKHCSHLTPSAVTSCVCVLLRLFLPECAFLIKRVSFAITPSLLGSRLFRFIYLFSWITPCLLLPFFHPEAFFAWAQDTTLSQPEPAACYSLNGPHCLCWCTQP